MEVTRRTGRVTSGSMKNADVDFRRGTARFAVVSGGESKVGR